MKNCLPFTPTYLQVTWIGTGVQVPLCLLESNPISACCCCRVGRYFGQNLNFVPSTAHG